MFAYFPSTCILSVIIIYQRKCANEVRMSASHSSTCVKQRHKASQRAFPKLNCSYTVFWISLYPSLYATNSTSLFEVLLVTIETLTRARTFGLRMWGKSKQFSVSAVLLRTRDVVVFFFARTTESHVAAPPAYIHWLRFNRVFMPTVVEKIYYFNCCWWISSLSLSARINRQMWPIHFSMVWRQHKFNIG